VHLPFRVRRFCTPGRDIQALDRSAETSSLVSELDLQPATITGGTMSEHEKSDSAKLAELIDGVHIAMLTSIDLDGSLHTRPLATLQYDAGDYLWFFTGLDSAKADEVERDMRVSVAYAHPTKHIYVAVAGTAEILQDRAKQQELWSPMVRAWFPEGLDDPNLGLMRVRIERAEYWTSPGRAAYLFEAARSTITGKQTQMGENRKLQMD
jgi:general stress protein 26